MPQDPSDRSGGPAIKVVDRRRFRGDGEPVGDTAPAQGAASGQAGRPETAPAPAAPPQAEQKLQEQAARIDELARAYAALLEDNRAFRARLERERDRVLEAERAGVAQALLEAADELERALAAIAPDSVERGSPLANLQEGVRLTLGGLAKRIAELGATRLAVTGKPFDPLLAEAVDVASVADAAQDGVVVDEVRAGYRIGDRILRPARVRVGRLAPG